MSCHHTYSRKKPYSIGKINRHRLVCEENEYKDEKEQLNFLFGKRKGCFQLDSYFYTINTKSDCSGSQCNSLTRYRNVKIAAVDTVASDRPRRRDTNATHLFVL